MLFEVNVSGDAVQVHTGRTKGTPMRALRRLATLPTPPAVRAWHLEALTVAALAGGLFGMVTGAY